MNYLMLSTALSTISLGIAIVALVFIRRTIELPRRILADYASELADLNYAVESISSSLKRLNARVGMREARAAIKSGDDAEEASNNVDHDPTAVSQLPGESSAEWKARTRRRLHMRSLGN